MNIFLLFLETVIVVWLLLVFLSGLRSFVAGAPYVPIPGRLVKDILATSNPQAHDTLCDLGCSDARVLISAARDFEVRHGEGYEIALWPYLKGKCLVAWHGLNGRIILHRQSIDQADLSKFSLIYIYLFPKLVERLAMRINEECVAGTKIICPSFPIDTQIHRRIRLIKSLKIAKMSVYLYEKI